MERSETTDVRFIIAHCLFTSFRTLFPGTSETNLLLRHPYLVLLFQDAVFKQFKAKPACMQEVGFIQGKNMLFDRIDLEKGGAVLFIKPDFEIAQCSRGKHDGNVAIRICKNEP